MSVYGLNGLRKEIEHSFMEYNIIYLYLLNKNIDIIYDDRDEICPAKANRLLHKSMALNMFLL